MPPAPAVWETEDIFHLWRRRHREDDVAWTLNLHQERRVYHQTREQRNHLRTIFEFIRVDHKSMFVIIN